MFGEESSVCMAVFKIASGSRVCGSAAVPRETVWPAEIGRIGLEKKKNLHQDPPRPEDAIQVPLWGLRIKNQAERARRGLSK